MEKKIIVYVPRRSRIRLYKIAKAVKLSQQFKLVLLCEESYYDAKLFENLFDEVHFYSKKSKLRDNKYFEFLSKKLVFSFGLDSMIKILKKINPALVHTFCEPYDHISKILKESDYPVIMSDGADFSGISSGIENIDSKTREQEKFCFENVQGIIHKGPEYEIQYYRNHNYEIKAKELSWFDHCDEDLFAKMDSPKLSDKDGEVHLVYTGLISDKKHVGYINYLDFVQKLEKQKIHFHVYSNPYATRKNKKYLELDKELKYFHLHRSMPYKNVIEEISKYDWGMWWHPPTGERRVSVDKTKVAIGNKLFSYMEAGLPTIVGKHNGIGRNTINKFEMGWAEMTPKDEALMDKILSEIDFLQLRKNVEKARKELSLQNNFQSIVNFYNELITS